MNVRNIENNKGTAVKNQFVLTDYDKKVFQSYRSKIATYKESVTESNKLYLENDMWDYSVTTRRHFKTFINEETPFTYETKQQWLKEIKNNDLIEVL